MSITTADRTGARQKARARVTTSARSRGVYPVTVGGIVAGYVERHPLATSKTAVVWSYADPDGKRLGYGFNTRKVAVEMVADTDFAAKAYRESAREGTHGTAEERRVREEDADALAAIDRELDETVVEGAAPADADPERDEQGQPQPGDLPTTHELPSHRDLIEVFRKARFSAAINIIDGAYQVTVYAPEDHRLLALRQLATEHGQDVWPTIAPSVYVLLPTPPAPVKTSPEESGFVVEEVLKIRSIDAQPGDLIIAIGDEVLEEPFPVVKEGAQHINGPEKGPIGVRLDIGSRSTVTYLYVDQHPLIEVRRPC